MGETGWKTRAAVAGLLSSGLLLAPGMSRPARACGGFWCSQQAPVNQADEQIIFIDHPDDTVTAIIQIRYVGPSERFAWLIPIAGDPEVAVSSNIAFQRLEPATAPSYSLRRSVEGVCKLPPPQLPTGFAAQNAAGPVPSSRGASSMNAPPISVVSQGSVGPYDYTTISVDPTLPNPADAAIEWFGDEGYDLSGVDAQLLGPYLAEGLNLLAFKLTKGSDAQTGSIRPVMLTYKSSRPMIPIRPTAVAAQDDMGVLVWVAGATQAVPDNYKSLVLNEALINWFSWRATYDDVVTAAADEADGQGFVTEFATPTQNVPAAVYTPADEQQWQQLSQASYDSPTQGVQRAFALYSRFDGWTEAIEKSVTLPVGITANQYAAQPFAYPQVQVDLQRLLTELHERVVKPLAETQRLLSSQPYLTRLYSTMSAEEMTVDPVFAFNPDLADVDRIHTAKQVVLCNPNVLESQAPWRVELPRGGSVFGRGAAWPLALNSMPVNLKVVQLSTTGSGRVVQDNSEAIGSALFARANMFTPPTQTPPATGVMIGGTQTVRMNGEPRAKSGADCAVRAPGAAAAQGWLGLLGLSLALLIRRRVR